MPTTRVKRTAFSSYSAYVSRLQSLAVEVGVGADWNARVVAALDGEASAELRRLAALKTRRKFGAYFTGTKLSRRLLKKCAAFDDRRIFYDPTCGMGDLLIAAARKLPLGKNLCSTIKQWGQRLMGTDLHAEFIKGTKMRLILLAQQRHRTNEVPDGPLDRFFPHVRVGNGLEEVSAFRRANTLLMNPPFGLVPAPPNCTWAGGQISEAATFMVTALEQVRRGTELLAILPEVLRSGSFSEHWRNRISDLADVHFVKAYGIFDDSADVDVFLLRLVRRARGDLARTKRWPSPRKVVSGALSDFFDVHVGRVVPHRDPEKGIEYPYIHPRCVPTWKIMREFPERRRHEGLVYETPFVVIRRTSRPGHRYRAAATVIAGKKKPVAVENHLIVCEPKDRTLKSCRELMKQLKTEAINNFLNKRIRCRHLTVGAVEAIPLKM